MESWFDSIDGADLQKRVRTLNKTQLLYNLPPEYFMYIVCILIFLKKLLLSNSYNSQNESYKTQLKLR